MKKQVHLYYKGRVQGVGFRYTAEDIARQMGVSGWVKNLHEGRVEMVAEAEEKTLEDFLGRIKEDFRSYITDTDAEYSAAKGEFKGFEIRF